MDIAPNILVVDDDEAIRQFVSATLKMKGYMVTAVSSAKEAISACQGNNHDLALLDIGLPDMDGIDLLKNLKAQHPELVVIILTGIATVETTINALNTGASGYITKPVSINELLIHVRESLDKLRLLKDNQRLVRELKKELSRKKRVEDELRNKNQELLLWTRELNCLYGVSHILERRDITLEDLFQQLVETISSYWPENSKVCTRITYGGKKYVSGTCPETSATYSSEILIGNKIVGLLELMIHDPSNGTDDALILRIETQLLDTIARRLRHIVEYKDSENKQRELETQLLQTEKMASIGQLAAGVAHEINNPTGFIISNLNTFKEYHEQYENFLNVYDELHQMIANNKGKNSSNQNITAKLPALYQAYQELDLDFIRNDCPEMISECMDGMERIRGIVLDLKNFAHPGQELPELADLNNNLDSVLNIVWNELKYKAKIKKDFSELPEIKCHPQQLNQVFMNLLVNAGQAIVTKGEIHITTQRDSDHVCIKIADNGMGIAEKNIGRIFDPFFTTKDIGKGTGLGLNIVYNIVKKHGGTISVSSLVDCGTEFTVRLPIGNSKFKTGLSNS